MSTDRCSAAVDRGDLCRNGFPQRLCCFKASTVIVPVCCDERLCARIYPEGKPPEHIVRAAAAIAKERQP